MRKMVWALCALLALGCAAPASAARFYVMAVTGVISGSSVTGTGSPFTGMNLDGLTGTSITVIDGLGANRVFDNGRLYEVDSPLSVYSFFGVGNQFVEITQGATLTSAFMLASNNQGVVNCNLKFTAYCGLYTGQVAVAGNTELLRYSGQYGDVQPIPLVDIDTVGVCENGDPASISRVCESGAVINYGNPATQTGIQARINGNFVRFGALTLTDLAPGMIIPGFNDADAVPEPATWALMLGGFGLIGASLRRRRFAPPPMASRLGKNGAA